MERTFTEPSEGGLKELVHRWFTETQAPLILNNGNFPDWFQGFAARRDAEDLLRDKALGCFLIRLSDKAIGYILSYRGVDRCRHFVITQDQDGQFGVSGDCQTYSSLPELISHYRAHPIQPFGETLTSSCHQVNSTDLYDVVSYNTRRTSGVSVQALRTLWDQKNVQQSHPVNNHQTDLQNDPLTAQPPALPPKSKNRKLTGAVSMDTTLLSQGLPPVPKRGLPLSFSLSESLPNTASHLGGTETTLHKSERLRGSLDLFETTGTSSPGDLCPPGFTQAESRSRSLPRLSVEEDEDEEEEEEYSNQLSLSFSSLPTPLKKVTCHTYSLHDHRDCQSGPLSERQADDMEMSKTNPLYQDAEVPSRPGDHLYSSLPENTYELIPGEAAAVQGNMYESLEDMKTQKSKSTWGKNNMKWKKFLPDYKKK
ncbi:SH2 domain-containing protein 7 [Cheilinus undulatus]|uniref:SH2 domain-containing protein 7 n=1 Tax=Cheilinus undulatus TaxID=241271 RepID=UPI001BD5C314|nr:SH2 domain-containing protein 7 [Cheilinus undulatus]